MHLAKTLNFLLFWRLVATTSTQENSSTSCKQSGIHFAANSVVIPPLPRKARMSWLAGISFVARMGGADGWVNGGDDHRTLKPNIERRSEEGKKTMSNEWHFSRLCAEPRACGSAFRRNGGRVRLKAGLRTLDGGAHFMSWRRWRQQVRPLLDSSPPGCHP